MKSDGFHAGTMPNPQPGHISKLFEDRTDVQHCQKVIKSYTINTDSSIYSNVFIRTYTGGIIGGSKDQLWCPVVPRADVRDIRLSTNQLFCTKEEAKQITFSDSTGKLSILFLFLTHFQTPESCVLPHRCKIQTLLSVNPSNSYLMRSQWTCQRYFEYNPAEKQVQSPHCQQRIQNKFAGYKGLFSIGLSNLRAAVGGEATWARNPIVQNPSCQHVGSDNPHSLWCGQHKPPLQLCHAGRQQAHQAPPAMLLCPETPATTAAGPMGRSSSWAGAVGFTITPCGPDVAHMPLVRWP